MSSYTASSMFIKYRRYCASFPTMWRLRLTELLALICCAAVLATVYVWCNGVDTKADETFDIRKIAKVKLADHPVPKNESEQLAGDLIAAVLVICASRPKAIENHMNIIKYLRKSASSFPVVISQDGDNEAVHRIVKGFSEKLRNVSYIQHNQSGQTKNAYEKIAAHYKFALDYMFKERKYEYVIVTEDDLELGTDFFSYFTWGRKLLESDPTIWCISAWNDNGTPQTIDTKKSSLTWRTDFFPGLGWMLSRTLWEELSPNFPTEFWDDWMRKQEVRKGRSCVRPEIPRTSHNMKLAGKGSSGGLYKKFLSSIHHSDSVTDFSLIPTEGMVKDHYDATLKRQVADSKLVLAKDIGANEWDINHSYRIVYDNMRTWVNLANSFGLMSDVRGGMMRTAYYGIVTTVFSGCRVFLYHQSVNITDLESFQYDPVWDKQNRYIEFQQTYCKLGRWTGVCDPYSNEMKEYFRRKGWTKRLPAPDTLVMI